MFDTLPDIRGWRPPFCLPKQMLLLAPSGSQPPFLIGCTTTALKSDNATAVSEYRPLVRDYLSENRLVPSSPPKRRCRQCCVCPDQPLTARQLFQSRFGIRSEQFRIRPSPESHAPDRQATPHFPIPAVATSAPDPGGGFRQKLPSPSLLYAKKLWVVSFMPFLFC